MEKESEFSRIWSSIVSVPGSPVRDQSRWVCNWLYTIVDGLPRDAVIVEIGPLLGRSTTAMAFACRGTDRHIYCIDTFKGDSSGNIHGQCCDVSEDDEFLTHFNNNICSNDLTRYVTPVSGVPAEVGKTWNRKIDFLLIGGSHEYDDIVIDFETFNSHVKTGSIIACHDVLPAWTGPYTAWKNRIRDKLIEPSHFFSIAYGRRRAVERDFISRVHAIIPVHNRVEMTRECLGSIFSQTCIENISVSVVDDGSTDGTSEMIAKEFPDVNVIEGDGGLWWTGAVAKALDQLRDRFDADDYFMLVNNDVSLSPDCVEMLVLDSLYNNRACIAPLAVTDTGATSSGWGPGLATFLMDFEKQYNKLINSNHLLEAHAIYGRCSLFPVEILDVVGNYDAETFPHYWGDTDFCLRARPHGFKFFITGRTTIRVTENESTSGFQLEFRNGPQGLARVYEAMTSIRSIDNLKHVYTYMKRHHPGREWRSVVLVFLRLLRQYRPFYYIYYFFRGGDRVNADKA